ncbi:SAM dependent carboxyl methyltransferase [Dillenia turbinata]|uniref:SAM dependent carboxyl methyltransferase n=1 Tax=Dillenia turbinata TaxID=194707 RepID=A0AAN8VCN6_9MAGN
MEGSVAMNGGDGPNSYTMNSSHQKAGLDRAKHLLQIGIEENLEVLEDSKDMNNQKIYRISDLGCSVGPNTFICVQAIMESIILKYESLNLGQKIPEFLVFFNDHVTNDFNTLLQALPSDRNYLAAAVPGSFHDRLFPKSSMNFIHSSFALHWLSKVPQEVTTKDSPAWNKGRITYVDSCPEVVEAYTSQFQKDMDNFFELRSVEVAKDGLMVILILCRVEGSPPTEAAVSHMNEGLGYALMDMAKEGLVDEGLVDSFNIPIYIPTALELKEAVTRNGKFSIEILEKTHYPPQLDTPEKIQICCQHIRAALEGMVIEHFGSQINNELFNRYPTKLEELSRTPFYASIAKTENLFLLVKRNAVV